MKLDNGNCYYQLEDLAFSLVCNTNYTERKSCSISEKIHFKLVGILLAGTLTTPDVTIKHWLYTFEPRSLKVNFHMLGNLYWHWMPAYKYATKLKCDNYSRCRFDGLTCPREVHLIAQIARSWLHVRLTCSPAITFCCFFFHFSISLVGQASQRALLSAHISNLANASPMCSETKPRCYNIICMSGYFS